MKIREAILARAICAVGGRESKAYTDYDLCERVIADIEEQLEREFDVRNIADIPYAPCSRGIDWKGQALAIIEEYELPLCLQERISNCNREGQKNGHGDNNSHICIVGVRSRSL